MYSPSLLVRHSSIEITLILLVAMVLFYWFGLRARIYTIKRTGVEKNDGIGTIEGSILGLLALMLSFTFSMSSGRHDKRVDIIAQEANDIGTAVLRADLYPDSIRIPLRADFKKYVEARILFSTVGGDVKKMLEANDSSAAIQARLWAIVSKAGQDKENIHRTGQMIPAMNQMFDIVTTRNAALLAKVPDLILYMMFLLCLTSSFILGYAGGKQNDWIVALSFNIMIGLAIFMILDLDRPRTGVITSKEANNQIVQLRDLFK